MKIDGKTFVRDFDTGKFVAKEDARTKVYSLASGATLIYELPVCTNLDGLAFQHEYGHLYLTDGKELTMNLSEHSAAGRRV